MAKKMNPLIPLAAAGLGVALLMRGSKKKNGKFELSESERGEILAGLPDSAEIEYEDGQILLGEHFLTDNYLPFVDAQNWSGATTSAITYFTVASFVDRDGESGPQKLPLKELHAMDPEASDELLAALSAISEVHYEQTKASKGEAKPIPWGTMAQRVKKIAQEGSSISKYMIALIEEQKAQAE